MENTENANDEFPTVLVKCRRGQDMATNGQECVSMQAYNMSTPGDTIVRFKCVKCGHTWVVPVGGQFNLPPGV
jgi:hypothetical protein